MTNVVKVLIAIGSVVVIGLLGLIVYSLHQVAVQQQAIQTEQVAQRQLVDGIVRSQTDWATKKDVTDLITSNGVNADALKAIQNDMATLKANLTTANVVVATSQGQNLTNQASTGIGPVNPHPPSTITESCPGGGSVTCPSPDPFGFMQAQQNYALNEKFGTVSVPFGTVGFSAFQAQPWSVDISSRKYTLVNVIGKDENERDYVYNQFNITVNGKTYDVPISATTKQVYPTAQFSWWNPRLLLGLDGGFNVNHSQGELTPSVSLGLMSYGQYKTTPDWSVLEVGVGFQAVNNRPVLVFTPASFNIGKQLFSPLIDNTYIGPSAGLATDGSWTLGGGIRVGF